MIDDPIANELRNPNTRTDDTVEADTPVDSQQGEPANQKLVDAHMLMIQEKWRRNIETDVGKVRRGARQAKNFVSWLDDHYENTQPKIDESMKLIVDSMQCFAPNVTYTPGRQYATDSKNLLLDIAGSCVNDLQARVTEATETWQDRITTYLPEFQG